jgi:excinuclease UvrABC nuclease subunit
LENSSLWSIYRMKNKEDKILYIGQTIQPMKRRIEQHFGKNGYLKKIVEAVEIIETAKVPNDADMNIYEAYYIAIYKPQWNGQLKTSDKPTVILPELNFEVLEEWRTIKPRMIARCKREEEREYRKKYGKTLPVKDLIQW